MVVFFFSIKEPHVQVPDTKWTASDFAVSFVHTHTHTHTYIYIYMYVYIYIYIHYAIKKTILTQVRVRKIIQEKDRNV